MSFEKKGKEFVEIPPSLFIGILLYCWPKNEPPLGLGKGTFYNFWVYSAMAYDLLCGKLKVERIHGLDRGNLAVALDDFPRHEYKYIFHQWRNNKRNFEIDPHIQTALIAACKEAADALVKSKRGKKPKKGEITEVKEEISSLAKEILEKQGVIREIKRTKKFLEETGKSLIAKRKGIVR